MSAIMSEIISAIMAFVVWFMNFFGINNYTNGLDDIDYSAVKNINFSSELVLDDVHSDSYIILQGGCTDGKYAYYCSLNTLTNLCSISKYEIATWKEVARRDGMPVDHGNDITYNRDKDCLVVCHNTPRRTYVSYVNKNTLKIIETFEIPLKIFSITYDSIKDRYCVGIAHTFDFAILDKDFNVVKKFKGVVPESTAKQGMDSDNKYIYFLLSFPNAISVYDWDGNHKGIFKMNDDAKKYESENIFHINDDLYIGYNSGYGKVYKTTIEALYE